MTQETMEQKTAEYPLTPGVLSCFGYAWNVLRTMFLEFFLITIIGILLVIPNAGLSFSEDIPWFFAVQFFAFSLIYFVFLTTFHYTWIRTAQPTRGSLSGIFLAVAVVILMFSLWNSVRIHSLPDIGFWLMLAGLLATSVVLLIGGRRLHRDASR